MTHWGHPNRTHCPKGKAWRFYTIFIRIRCSVLTSEGSRHVVHLPCTFQFLRLQHLACRDPNSTSQLLLSINMWSFHCSRSIVFASFPILFLLLAWDGFTVQISDEYIPYFLRWMSLTNRDIGSPMGRLSFSDPVWSGCGEGLCYLKCGCLRCYGQGTLWDHNSSTILCGDSRRVYPASSPDLPNTKPVCKVIIQSLLGRGSNQSLEVFIAEG